MCRNVLTHNLNALRICIGIDFALGWKHLPKAMTLMTAHVKLLLTVNIIGGLESHLSGCFQLFAPKPFGRWNEHTNGHLSIFECRLTATDSTCCNLLMPLLISTHTLVLRGGGDIKTLFLHDQHLGLLGSGREGWRVVDVSVTLIEFSTQIEFPSVLK